MSVYRPPVCSAVALKVAKVPKNHSASPSSEPSAYGMGLGSLRLLLLYVRARRMLPVGEP